LVSDDWRSRGIGGALLAQAEVQSEADKTEAVPPASSYPTDDPAGLNAATDRAEHAKACTTVSRTTTRVKTTPPMIEPSSAAKRRSVLGGATGEAGSIKGGIRGVVEAGLAESIPVAVWPDRYRRLPHKPGWPVPSVSARA
jgi:hypothetical protein